MSAARTIPATFADISVRDSGRDGPAVLLIHGNSSCKEIFGRQFESKDLAHLRLVAFDLPGHGASTDAADPHAAYTLAGYARTAIEVLGAHGIERAAVFGWSLGGHVALDMICRWPGLAGVMICGAPPITNSLEGVAAGFAQTPEMALASAPSWTDAEAEAFARTAVEPAPVEPFMLEAARRTPGQARERFFANALFEPNDDQRKIAETATTPLAIVNGARDPFLNHGYFATLRYANLWRGKVFSLEGLGHAPFWQAPEVFNPLLAAFVAETAR